MAKKSSPEPLFIHTTMIADFKKQRLKSSILQYLIYNANNKTMLLVSFSKFLDIVFPGALILSDKKSK